ncbi:ATP-binding protein [Candidatus Dojkabacteria bacterium]|jgi:hypothetical protein|nr:ATP-binding protein [Candidatus Dojkabacteria bacterium]
MNKIKNYNDFSSTLEKVDFFDKFNEILNKLKNWIGKHYWIYWLLILKKANKLPEGVNVYCPESYASLSDIKEMNSIELKELKESFGEKSEYVPLGSTESTWNVPEVDSVELKENIIDIYKSKIEYLEKKEADPKKPIYMGSQSAFIWGASGVGKTEILNQVSRELDIAIITIHLSQRDPSDFKGVPYTEFLGKTKVVNQKDQQNEREQKRTKWALPAVFPRTNGKNKKGGILFFDELNTAHSSILDASLPFIQTGKIGTSYVLPDHWIIIAAGNRKEDVQKKLAMDPILFNRFQHITYVPIAKNTVDYFKSKNINPDIISFLSDEKYQKYLHRKHKYNKDPNWTSPRRWEEASDDDYFERGEDWNKELSKKQLKEIYWDHLGEDTARVFADYVEEKNIERRKIREENAKKMKEKMSKNKNKPDEEEKEKDLDMELKK